MKYVKQFTYVLEVVKTRSITLAAENLNMTQPALTKYLKKLESELGMEIFDRSTNPISLTDAGERYVEAARRIIDADNQLSKQLEQIRDNHNTAIHVGISPSRAPFLLPRIIRRFREDDKQTRIIIDECGTKELSEKLACGNLDLIISICDEDTSCFMRTDLFDESIMLAVSKDLILQESEKNAAAPEKLLNEVEPTIDILRSSPIISSGKGQKIWQMLNNIQTCVFVGEALIECQNIVTAMALVQAGIGVMLAPSYMAKKMEAESNPFGGVASMADSVRFIPLNLKEYPLLAEETNRKICLFYRKEQFLSRAEKRFIECSTATANTDCVQEGD